MKKKETKAPEFINSPLNNPMRNYAVYRMKKSEAVLVALIAFVLGGIVSQIFYGNLFLSDGEKTMATYISNAVFFVLVGALAVKFLLPIYVDRQLANQRNKLKSQFCDMLESLTSSFSTGSNVIQAFTFARNDLQMQYDEDAFILHEMNEILEGAAQNIGIEEMLRSFGERSGNEDIVSFADVFDICYRKGGDMQSVIFRTHSVIMEKVAIADEIETKLTANKMQHNVMSIMPIVVVAMLKATNDTFAVNFATPLGVIVNTVAIGVFLAAYKYGLKIVEVKE